MQVQVCGDFVARATEALRRSRIRDLQELTVEPHGDAIALYGRAKSFYHKQLAQEVVRQAVDGLEVLNHVRVVPVPE